MIETVRRYSARLVMDTSTEFDTERRFDVRKKFPGLRWFSFTTVYANGGRLSTGFRFGLTSKTDPHPKNIKVTFTLTNRTGKKLVNTCVAKLEPMGAGVLCIVVYIEDEVGWGKEHVAVTLDFNVEITGVFPKTRDFGVLDPDFTDVVLVAEGEKFHVSKAILTTHSSYFRDLLSTEKAEYELENITAKVLQELLQVIYHAPEIYDDNVEELLEAARQLDLPLVTRACKDHFKEASCCLIDEDKERLVSEYDLELLELRSQKDFDFDIQREQDDLILKVEDKRFHVNRGLLATFSSYFYTMFFKGYKESKEPVVELKLGDPETFQQLLEIIYHCPNIHENNVEALLDLNMIYDAQPVTAQCRKFIDGKNGLSMEEKQRLIKEYFPK